MWEWEKFIPHLTIVIYYLINVVIFYSGSDGVGVY